MTHVVIVIPCFNEAGRFKTSEAEKLLADPNAKLILVNDGSTDSTETLLHSFAQEHSKLKQSNQVQVMSLGENLGKAEAVRLGMNAALEMGADITGYLDADFATPADEMVSLIERLQTSEAKVVLGSRWQHLGANIERDLWRHYGGRVFATFASIVLGLKVYDTQCGAKLFRVTSELSAALGDQFASRWAFDVELIGRLYQCYQTSEFLEVPLNTWVDVVGSKIRLIDMIHATLSLWQIRRSLKLKNYSNSLGVHHGKNSGIS